ncbi:hypothetical protein ACIF85_13700 [Streptomyces sp. NPDC086033]|uniref:hypothetical protein n=1 Tax=Streptomyces sp. NPDC086033 TaxID=3365747 RepID=UPI0037D30630
MRQGHLRPAAGEPPLAGGKVRPAPTFEWYELVYVELQFNLHTYVDKMSTQYSAFVEDRVEGLPRSG